jgi:hypothetical protein
MVNLASILQLIISEDIYLVYKGDYPSGTLRDRDFGVDRMCV